MQWHPSFTHIHIIHCSTEPRGHLNPLSYGINTPGARFQRHRRGSEAPAQALLITETHGRKRGGIYKLMSHIPGLGLDVVPAGTHFLMASLQPLLHMPLQSASSSAPTLLAVWPNPTRLKLFTAAPKLCLVQTVSVKFCLCLFLQISHYCFPVPAPPLLHPTVNCTMIFSVSCITRTSLSPAPCLILVFTIPGHCLPNPFPVFSVYKLHPPFSIRFQLLLHSSALTQCQFLSSYSLF